MSVTLNKIDNLELELDDNTLLSNLFGIERKIAYAGKKYHSGTICSGVTIGLPGI